MALCDLLAISDSLLARSKLSSSYEDMPFALTKRRGRQKANSPDAVD
jgi:hypothetical protein